MDICQRCLYSSKTYSYIGNCIIHAHRDHNEMIVYISAKYIPDDSFTIERNGILLSFNHGPHCDLFLHPSDDDHCDTEANSENTCINLEQALRQTHIYGKPHLGNCLATKPIRKKYVNIIEDHMDLWWSISCEDEDGLVHWCAKHSLSRVLSISFSETLWWQPSATSPCPTRSSKLSMQCCMQWASTVGNWAKCVTIVQPTQTIFLTKITHVCFTAILLNPLSF